MENKNAVEQNDELYKIATDIFSERFIPIFLIDYKRIPKHFGSRCLININNKNYLATAAHSLMPEKIPKTNAALPALLLMRTLFLRS